jgi:periplasmic protein TonB
MRQQQSLFVAGAVLMACVTGLLAQEVYRPGNGVSLPVLVKEVHPPVGDTAGTVMLDCVVRDDGAVSDVKVVTSPDTKLNMTAVETLTQWRFKPGMKDGKPVAVAVHVELTFARK